MEPLQRSDTAGDTRASDQDRDTVAEALRRHHVAGRLGNHEFDERVERCFAAKSVSELEALLADLPRPQRRTRRAVFLPHWDLWALPVILVFAFSEGDGPRFLWLVIPLFFFVLLPALFQHRSRTSEATIRSGTQTTRRVR